MQVGKLAQASNRRANENASAVPRAATNQGISPPSRLSPTDDAELPVYYYY